MWLKGDQGSLEKGPVLHGIQQQSGALDLGLCSVLVWLSNLGKSLAPSIIVYELEWILASASIKGWLGWVPVTHAYNPTREAEIRRITVQGQHGQIVCETLPRKNPSQTKGWWSGSRCRPRVQTPVPPNKQTKIKELTENIQTTDLCF
jgi:hypothetical protein